MEKLFAKKGIKYLSYLDTDGSKLAYAFTPQMLEDKIFVELAVREMGDEEDPEYETVISVFTIRDGSSYDFTICHDDRPVIPLMYLYRLVLDTIELISGCEKQTLLEELKQAATGVSISKEVKDKELKERMYGIIEEKIATVHKLINLNRLNSN
ncbi:hypothetical protein CKK33_16810 [Mucilaginibacter sp. MD40]|uniref:hypothetical protein n=1 Tax=Mucilaginibacter sp. MD40 TaxID=2029590 RepID=UPI000BAC985D|nr:hypothetical protein [Mucilaginibacter sp. MD40]PAW95064.1 hypothetical protein CKK33_16810 [Mucilaginibacter sp. MD40]